MYSILFEMSMMAGQSQCSGKDTTNEQQSQTHCKM
jgi:hypothetical protein